MEKKMEYMSKISDEIFFSMLCFDIRKVTPARIERSDMFNAKYFYLFQKEMKDALEKEGSPLKDTMLIFAESKQELENQINRMFIDRDIQAVKD